jgi:hypothetical protein
MKPKTVIVYDRTNTDSLVKKNKLKRENPRAIIVEVSNKKAVSEATKGIGNIVHNVAGEMDKRQLKGDVVKTTPPKKEKAPKKETKPKKKKAPEAKKPPLKKASLKKTNKKK